MIIVCGTEWRRVFDVGVLELEKVSSGCRLERLRLEEEEVE